MAQGELLSEHAENDPSAPVRCSGSTMGSRDAMLTYVDAMLAASDEFMSYERAFRDQGYHNTRFCLEGTSRMGCE